MSKIEDKFYELINAQTLTYEERTFIFDVNNWKIKLDFLEHHEMVASIKKKQSVFEDIEDKKGMINYIENEIEEKENQIDDHEYEIRRCESEVSRYKDILKTLNSI